MSNKDVRELQLDAIIPDTVDRNALEKTVRGYPIYGEMVAGPTGIGKTFLQWLEYQKLQKIAVENPYGPRMKIMWIEFTDLVTKVQNDPYFLDELVNVNGLYIQDVYKNGVMAKIWGDDRDLLAEIFQRREAQKYNPMFAGPLITKTTGNLEFNEMAKLSASNFTRMMNLMRWIDLDGEIKRKSINEIVD